MADLKGKSTMSKVAPKITKKESPPKLVKQTAKKSTRLKPTQTNQSGQQINEAKQSKVVDLPKTAPKAKPESQRPKQLEKVASPVKTIEKQIVVKPLNTDGAGKVEVSDVVPAQPKPGNDDGDFMLQLMMLLGDNKKEEEKVEEPKPEDLDCPDGTTLKNDRFKVTKKLGFGGFGAIYEAYDNEKNEKVAIKCEHAKVKHPVLQVEIIALKKLQGKSNHACRLYASGKTEKYNYIVMTLCGENLYDLRMEQMDMKFTMSTSCRLMVQITQSIEDVHKVGLLHRDIKPANFAIGKIPETKKLVYILDFGLCRLYLEQNGTLKPARKTVGFRGTVRYASLAAHRKQELGRHDDLLSAYYMFVEFLTGTLPWRRLHDRDVVEKSKVEQGGSKLVKDYPPCLSKFIQHIESLDYITEPKYELLKSLLQEMITILEVKMSDPYDWEND